MNKNKISAVLFYLLSFITLAFACLYLFSPHVMPYHLAFLGIASEDELLILNPRLPAMFHALMRIIGYSTLGIALLSFYITHALVKHNQKWAWWSLLIIYGATLPGYFLVTFRVASEIPAGESKPPYFLTLAMILMLLSGLYFSKEKSDKS